MPKNLETLQPIVHQFAQLLVNEVRAVLAASAEEFDDQIDKPEVLTPQQVGREIGVSPATVRKSCAAGLIGRDVSQPKSPHRKWLIHREDLASFLRARPADTKPAKNRRPQQERDVIQFFS